MTIYSFVVLLFLFETIWNYLKPVMPSSHLILCHLLLLLPPIPPIIWVFSNESSLCMRWPQLLHFQFCCFLTCIQISQEAGQVVWYSHLFQNFPQFIVIHTVKGFGIVNKAELDVFLELSCFFYDPADVGNLISGFSAFSKTSLNIRKFTFHVLLMPGLE